MASMSTHLLSKETYVTLPAEGKEQTKLRLLRAAISGHWDFAKDIYKDDPEVFNDKIAKNGHTALHIAAAAGHTQFVNEIIKKMTRVARRLKNDGEEKDDGKGNTAFCHAAITGNVDIAKIMWEADNGLVAIPGKNDKLPLYLAAVFGRKEMVDFLYEKTLDSGVLKNQDRQDLLVTLIESGIYDVAKKMVEAHRELTAAVDTNGKTAFNALARKNVDPIAWKNGISLCYWKEVQKKNTMHQAYLGLLQLVHEDDQKILEVIRNGSKTSPASRNDSNTSQGDGKCSQISKVLKSYNRPIFTAAAHGNVEFLITIIGLYPDLLFERDDETNHSIFHIAVLHRQENVFALIRTIGSIKYFLAAHEDRNQNNMLHLAGELSPQSRLDAIPGAAFQLQRELLWFEEVKKVVQPDYIEAKNDEGLTPRDLFLKRHKKLIDDGKTWMKETADQCMLVATLIAGVAFGAAISVPGGTDGGVPVLIKQTSFQVFAVADGLSLMFTIIAMLDFFSIRTSRSKLEDCLVRLPMMLLFGLIMLFISIVALMVAFVVAFFIVFGHGKLGLSVPIAALAPLAVLLFICLQRKLIGDVIRATCFSNLVFKPNKYSLLSEWKKSNESPTKSQCTNP